MTTGRINQVTILSEAAPGPVDRSLRAPYTNLAAPPEGLRVVNKEGIQTPPVKGVEGSGTRRLHRCARRTRLGYRTVPSSFPT